MHLKEESSSITITKEDREEEHEEDEEEHEGEEQTTPNVCSTTGDVYRVMKSRSFSFVGRRRLVSRRVNTFSATSSRYCIVFAGIFMRDPPCLLPFSPRDLSYLRGWL